MNNILPRFLFRRSPIVSRASPPCKGLLSPTITRRFSTETPQQDEQQQQPQQQQQQQQFISIEDFMKIRLVVGCVLNVEPVPKSKKLLKLTVDIGEQWGGKRTILSGIKPWFSSDGEDLMGKKVLVVENLAPRKMMGMESHGMLLMAYHVSNSADQPGEGNGSELQEKKELMSTIGPHLDDIPIGTVVS